MNTWIVGKGLMKHHCLDVDHRHANNAFKKLKLKN